MNEKERRGQRAKEILEDPIFVEAWEAVEREAIEALLAVPLDKASDLQAHQVRVLAVRGMRQELQTVIDNGVAATRRANRDQS